MFYKVSAGFPWKQSLPEGLECSLFIWEVIAQSRSEGVRRMKEEKLI